MLTKRYIDDHQVVERYLAGQLSDAERDEFEDYYAVHPDVLRELDAAAGIKLGVALLRESGELPALIAQRPAPRWRTGLALAATVLIAVVAGAYWFRNDAAAPPILAGDLSGLRASLPVAASYQVQRTRSDVDAVVALPSTGQAVRLRIRPFFEARPTNYRVELLSITPDTDARTPLAAADGLVLDQDGLLTVYLDATQLQPGNYELIVAGQTGASGSNEFLIEITAGERAAAP